MTLTPERDVEVAVQQESSAEVPTLDSGVFTMSIDTEMAWGMLHNHQVESHRYAYDRVREAVDFLVHLMEKYEIRSTWAFIGHLMLDSCSSEGGKHPGIVRPQYEWFEGDWFDQDPASSVKDDPIWYGPDLLERVRACKVPQEIGSHTFSHITVGDPGCTKEAFDSDLSECTRIASQNGINLRSFVYPRNKIGLQRTLVEHGFESYRGNLRRWYDDYGRVLFSIAHKIDNFLPIAPPVVYPDKDDGLWNIPASYYYPHSEPSLRDWGRRLPIWVREAKIRRGVDKAIEKNGIFHLWFHPFNLASNLEPLGRGLDRALAHVARMRDAGKLKVMSMSDLVDVLEGAPIEEQPSRAHAPTSVPVISTDSDEEEHPVAAAHVSAGEMKWPEPMGLKLSLEDLALLAMARKDLDEQAFHLLHSITHQPIDWNRVVESAEWHKLRGLAYRHLSTPAFEAHVPPAAMDVLRSNYIRNTARQMFFERELSGVLQLFKDNGIEAILMKGAALVPEIYDDDRGLRPMGDVDIIVRTDRALDADKLLRDIGFRPGVDEEEQERMRVIDRQLAALARPGSPVVVEIHTHLVATDSPIRFDINTIWERTVPHETNGVAHLTLDPTALLVAQTVNFMKDRRFYSYSALGQLCDVAEVVRKYSDEIDWDAFKPGGEFADLRGVVFGSLFMARGLLLAPVPEDVIEMLTPERFSVHMAATMVRDRVLGKDWLAKDLGGAGTTSAWKLPASMLRRIFLSRSQLEYRSRPGEAVTSKDLVVQNLKRMGVTAKFAARSILRPDRLYEDLSVDRWLKSLYEPDGQSGQTR